MSTLSQIISAGGGTVDVGGATFFPTPIPTNPTIGGKEYLRTGTLKTFSNTYSEFTDLSVLFGHWESSFYNTNWRNSSSGTPVNLVFANNIYYYVYSTVPNKIIRGTNLNADPDATNDYPTNEAVRDAIGFNNLIVLSGYNTSTGNVVIRNSTGNGVFNLSVNATVSGSSSGLDFVAASNNLVVIAAAAMTTSTGKIYTSTDGTNFTARSGPSSMSALNVRRFFWSPVANAFFYITDAGRIFTTTDGFTVTERTAPSGMPTSISMASYGNRNAIASSSTATVAAVGSNKLLRITGLTDYSIVDLTSLSNAGSLSSSDSVGSVIYDGSNFIFANAVSTDNGVNWTAKFSVVAPNAGSVSTAFRAFANNQVIMGVTILSEARLLNMTGYGAANTPTLMGTTTAATFSGSLPAYWRIK